VTAYNIIFAGTPHFAAATLKALIDSEHHVQAVYTQPDRPKGRGQHVTYSPVKHMAETFNLPIYQPQTLRDPAALAILKQTPADMMIVVAYGLILPPTVLEAFPLGCINVHASLLPKYRGAAPIQRAILAHEEQ